MLSFPTRLVCLVLLALPAIVRAQPIPIRPVSPLPVVEAPPPSAEELAALSPAEINARLHAAATRPGQLATVTALLAAGADPLDQLSLCRPPFILALQKGHADYAEAMLAVRPGICAQPWRDQYYTSTVGMVALYYATATGRTQFALRLINKERVQLSNWLPDPYQDPRSLLGQAVQHWDTELVRLLVEAGQNFNGSHEGFFPLLEDYTRLRGHEAAFDEMRDQHARKMLEARNASLDSIRNRIAIATDPEQKAHLQRSLQSQEEAAAKSIVNSPQFKRSKTLEKIRLLASFRAPGQDVAIRINDFRVDGSTPLSVAVQHDWPEVVAILVAAGADPNIGLIDRQRIINYVADKPEMLRALAGAPAERPDSTGIDGAEYIAAIHRDDSALLEKTPITPSLLAYRDPRKRSALHHAIEVENDALALRLIEAGTDLEASSGGGQTPLVNAAFLRRHEIMRVLLARGARPDGSAPGIPYPPLVAAAASADAEGVRILLAAGADPDRRDPNGVPVVVSAAMHSPSVETVRLLVEAGARLNVAIDPRGIGPLEATFEKDHADSLAYLLEQKTPWFYARRTNNSPLLAATRAKAWKCAHLLLGRGERDDRALALATDPLFKAALEDVLQAAGSSALDDAELWPGICADNINWRARVDAHLAGGGDVNYQAESWTPLFKAIASGNLDLVRYLVAKGADPRVRPLRPFINNPTVIDYLHTGTMQPAGLSISEFREYRAALIRILVPLEPATGFTDYEDRLADAVAGKSWVEVEAYIYSGVAVAQAVEKAKTAYGLTDEERAHALKLLKAPSH